jgi:MFS family permease
MFIPVPLLGYVCDRVGPAPLAVLAAGAFGVGYAGAAAAYARELVAVGGVGGVGESKWYGLMVMAFVAIGVGTCSMYMGAVATCAKNFGRGKHRGLALAVPIAAFGLSGMWLSQVGSRFFGDERVEGEVDVFKYFVFLAVLLFVVGLVGSFGLRIVDERDLIEEAVEELERSGILDGSAIFSPGRAENGYGAIGERRDPFDDMEDTGVKDPQEEEDRLKKQWVLNAETTRFLTDHTMWCFALGFFFMIGPGEAFINNMGTVIKTLYPPTLHYEGKPTSAATHVSIVGITSTAVRLLTGTLTDLLAPSPETGHIQITSTRRILGGRRFSISRVSFLLFFAVVLSLGLAGLASGLVQNHGEWFWVVSGLVGAGYGAVFSLTPIIITVIWGVENFATNWGIVAMFPALGATLWGLVYSAVYQEGAKKSVSPGGGEEQGNLCYGEECYAPAFWAMAASVWIACGLVLWAWKGRNGWSQRGILV